MNTSAPAQTCPHPAKPMQEWVSAAELMRGQTVLQIEHAGQRYQLRMTKNGKLILTK